MADKQSIITDINYNIVDLTTRLNDLHELYNLATEAAGIGVWDWWIQEDRLYWDRQMFKIFNVDPKDFDGTYSAFAKYIHPDDYTIVHSACLLALQDPSIQYRYSYRVSSAHNTRVLGNGKVYFKHEKPYRMIGVCLYACYNCKL